MAHAILQGSRRAGSRGGDPAVAEDGCAGLAGALARLSRRDRSAREVPR
jgi:hypothetical protein